MLFRSAQETIVTIGGSCKPCTVKASLLSIPEDEERLFLAGGGNPGCSARAGFSTACVSVPSTGSLIALLDASKPPMPAIDRNITVADAINAKVVANTIVNLGFNNQMSTLLLIKRNYLHCSD
jgi:hypothetical protein